MKGFIDARRAGVPLLALECSDPASTIAGCVKVINGKKDTTPLFQWTVITGLTALNEAASNAIMEEEIEPMQTLNFSECFGTLATKARRQGTKLEDAVIFIHMANRLVEGPEGFGPSQALWLCRDAFKAKHVMAVLLAPAITLPAELKQDVVVLSEPLPGEEELGKITDTIIEEAGLPPEFLNGKKAPVVETMRGLSAFGAEQILAMSIRKGGIDMESMRQLKRGYVSQMPGIEVRDDKITFDDIAGYDSVKTLLKRKITGKRPPRLVVWWDEFDRTIAGNSSDTSGVTQDQVAVLLQFLQDKLNEDKLSAMILVGVPGGGKSAVASATHNAADCECLRLDVGGMKDSLVGGSEKRIRNALKVCDAMAGGHILLIATCNSLEGVPSPIISRFALGVHYFDTPSEAEGLALWKLKRAKYEIPGDQANPTTAPLVGREIQQCCFLADELRIPLKEALQYITPYYLTNAKEIDSLRNQAHKRWLSASYPGFYLKPADAAAQAPSRRVQLEQKD